MMKVGMLRTILVLAAAGVGVVFALVVSLVNVGLQVPLPLLAIAPHVGGRMEERLAESAVELGSADQGSRARGEALAKAAIIDDPANAAAVRTLALTAAAQGQQARSLRLFRYAERLSRRDLPTELALIETAVQAGNVGEALRHYDRALRAFPKTTEFLFPVLDQAATKPEVAVPLGRILREHPAWRPWFLSRMAGDPAVSPIALVYLLDRIDIDPRHEDDRQVLDRSLARLVHDRQYEAAYRLYRRAIPASRGVLRDGGFDQESVLPPFDWALDDAGIRERVTAAHGYALHLPTQDQADEAARQLLLLPPASYRLTLSYGNVPAGEEATRPSVTIKCADTGVTIARLVLAAAGQPMRIGFDFAIPVRGCPAQWLIVSTGAGPDATATMPWIGHLSLTSR